jgi:hypothetical protein
VKKDSQLEALVTFYDGDDKPCNETGRPAVYAGIARSVRMAHPEFEQIAQLLRARFQSTGSEHETRDVP